MATEEWITLKDQELRDAAVDFSRHSGIQVADGMRFLGCQITFNPKGVRASRFGSQFHIVRSVIEDCSITGTGALKSLEFTNVVKFHRCRFVGRPFVETKFGPDKKDMQGDQWIVECDFSAADLRDVRFYQTPVETLLLPAWPYITAVARDGETVFAPPSSQRPALTSLLNAVFDFPWEDLPMKRAMESIVFGVGIRTNEASVQVSHAEDIVKRGAGSLERLRTALDRLAHPAIRY